MFQANVADIASCSFAFLQVAFPDLSPMLEQVFSTAPEIAGKY